MGNTDVSERPRLHCNAPGPRENGDLMGSLLTQDDWRLLPPNIQMKATRTPDCWHWHGARNGRGYGSVTNGHGDSVLVHRRVWEITRGPIPVGLTIDHLCMNKVCINPDHLEPVTRAENSRRAAAAQTHCKHGHPLSGDNIRLRHRADGVVQRVCRACSRRWSQEQRDRLKKAKAA